VSEIKSIGLTKLVKYIGKNVEKLSLEFIVQSIKLLKSDPEIYQNFKMKILNLRPDLPLDILDDKPEEKKIDDVEEKLNKEESRSIHDLDRT